jgi:hypothetical protein
LSDSSSFGEAVTEPSLAEGVVDLSDLGELSDAEGEGLLDESPPEESDEFESVVPELDNPEEADDPDESEEPEESEPEPESEESVGVPEGESLATPVSTFVEPEVVVRPETSAQVSQGEVPLSSRSFSATAICWERLARSAVGA